MDSIFQNRGLRRVKGPLSVGVVLLCSAAMAVTGVLKDGIYTGQSIGYKGPVRVEVTVENGRIAGVEVKEFRDNRARKVLWEMPRRMIEANSADVDVISGATISSRAVRKAVGQALDQAK